jgi:hypothetical protein
MKIEFTKFRTLDTIARTVKPGDTLESPKDAPDELLRAYVTNGIARDITPSLKSAPKVENISKEVTDHVS